MRFPPKPLTVGTPLPMNAADVASSLKVEWHDFGPISDAFVDEWHLHVGKSSWWTVRRRDMSTLAKDIASGNVGGKTAAVLALANHLASQLARAVEFPSAAGAEAECPECECPKEQGHFSWCESGSVARKAEIERFKIGDRVRLTARAAIDFPHWRGPAMIVDVDEPYWRIKVADGAVGGFTANNLEPVEAAPVFEWDLDRGVCWIGDTELYAGGDGSWSVYGTINKHCGWSAMCKQPDRFRGKSREECRAMAMKECEAAYLAAVKR